VNRVRPEIKNSWRLHHDNAPAHTAAVTAAILTKLGVSVIPQPAYSPDLATADFFLFPRIKRALKGHHLGTLENVKATATRCLKDIPIEAFSGAYAAWISRWKKCIAAGGSYFEEF